MDLTEYKVSPFVSILNVLVNPLRLDRSEEYSSFALIDSDDDQHMLGPKYTARCLFLPLMITSIWLLSLIVIFITKKSKCCLMIEFRNSGRKISPSTQKQQGLIKILSNKHVEVRGNIEDKIRYEILKKKMKRKRIFVSSIAVVGVIVVIPSVLFTLLLKNTYGDVSNEMGNMSFRLGKAQNAFELIQSYRDEIIQLKEDIISGMDSIEFQDCVSSAEYLQQTSTDISRALTNMSDHMELINLQESRQIFSDARTLSMAAEKSTLYTSYSALLTMVAMLLYSGTMLMFLYCISIVKRNNTEIRDRNTFQKITFSIVLHMSILLLVLLTVLSLQGSTLVDFCDAENGPSQTIILMISSSIHYQGTLFSDTIASFFSNDWQNLQSTTLLHESIMRSTVEIEKLHALLATCSIDNFDFFQNYMTKVAQVLPDSYSVQYISNTQLISDWFEGEVITNTCRTLPRYLLSCILFLLFFIISTVIILSLWISTKTDTEIFIQISNVEINGKKSKKKSIQPSSSIRIGPSPENPDWRQHGNKINMKTQPEDSKNETRGFFQRMLSYFIGTKRSKNSDLQNDDIANMNMHSNDDTEEKGEVEIELSDDEENAQLRVAWEDANGRETSDYFPQWAHQNSVLRDALQLAAEEAEEQAQHGSLIQDNDELAKKEENHSESCNQYPPGENANQRMATMDIQKHADIEAGIYQSVYVQPHRTTFTNRQESPPVEWTNGVGWNPIMSLSWSRQKPENQRPVLVQTIDGRVHVVHADQEELHGTNDITRTEKVIERRPRKNSSPKHRAPSKDKKDRSKKKKKKGTHAKRRNGKSKEKGHEKESVERAHTNKIKKSHRPRRTAPRPEHE